MTENSCGLITEFKTGKAPKEQPYDEKSGKYQTAEGESDGGDEKSKEREKAFRLMGILK